MTGESKEILSVMKEMFSHLENRFDNLENKVDNLENRFDNLENQVKCIDMRLENETNRNIQTLVDGYIQNAEKLQKLDIMSADIDVLKFDVGVIKAVVTTHSNKLQSIKQA